MHLMPSHIPSLPCAGSPVPVFHHTHQVPAWLAAGSRVVRTQGHHAAAGGRAAAAGAAVVRVARVGAGCGGAPGQARADGCGGCVAQVSACVGKRVCGHTHACVCELFIRGCEGLEAQMHG